MTSLECLLGTAETPFLRLHLIYYPLSYEFATLLELWDTETGTILALECV